MKMDDIWWMKLMEKDEKLDLKNGGLQHGVCRRQRKINEGKPMKTDEIRWIKKKKGGLPRSEPYIRKAFCPPSTMSWIFYPFTSVNSFILNKARSC